MQINIAIDVLRKFFTSAYGLPERGPTPYIEWGSSVSREGEVAGHPAKGSPAWRSKNAKAAADARHSKSGGSREKRAQIRELWESGKYSTRDLCAEEEYVAIGMSFSTARRALRGTPDPDR